MCFVYPAFLLLVACSLVSVGLVTCCWSFFFPVFSPFQLWLAVVEGTLAGISVQTKSSPLTRSLIKWMKHFEWAARRVIQFEWWGNVLLCRLRLFRCFCIDEVSVPMSEWGHCRSLHLLTCNIFFVLKHAFFCSNYNLNAW